MATASAGALLASPSDADSGLSPVTSGLRTAPPLQPLSKQRELLMMEFTLQTAAAPAMRTVKRLEVLAECRRTIEEYKALRRSVLHGHEEGSRHWAHWHKGAALQSRDLRMVDHSFAMDSPPSLLPRQYCFVVHVSPMHAIVLPGKVLLFPEEGADSELNIVIKQLRAAPDEHGLLIPFELKALEVLLLTITTYFTQWASQIEADVAVVCTALTRGKANTKTYIRQRDCVEDINQLLSLAKSAGKVISDVLDSEEELKLMRWPFEVARVTNPHAPTSTDPLHCLDSVQLMLESYFAEVEGVLSRMHAAKESLADADHQYTLVLNASRNAMMYVNLFLSVTMAVVAIAGLIPGFFGTNLTSNLEQTPGVFTQVVAGTLCACVGCVALTFTLLTRYLNKK